MKNKILNFIFAPHVKYDNLKEPYRFLVFFIPFIVFLTTGIAHNSPVSLLVVYIFALLWRVLYFWHVKKG